MYAHRLDKLDEMGLIHQIYKLNTLTGKEINWTDIFIKGK